MKINDLAREAYSCYFSKTPGAFREFRENLKLKWLAEGKDDGYYHWFMSQVALPKIFERKEQMKPGSICPSYWVSFDYLKFQESRLKYEGKSAAHLQPAIAKWREVFAEQKARRQEERDLEYWGYY